MKCRYCSKDTRGGKRFCLDCRLIVDKIKVNGRLTVEDKLIILESSEGEYLTKQ